MEIRKATEQDVQEIMAIYNEGIEDRIATLETEIKTDKYVMEWLFQRENRYSVIVMEENSHIVGWASINPYSHRYAYRGVGELSIYIKREYRGKGLGQKLLLALEKTGQQNEFYKLFGFNFFSLISTEMTFLATRCLKKLIDEPTSKLNFSSNSLQRLIRFLSAC